MRPSCPAKPYPTVTSVRCPVKGGSGGASLIPETRGHTAARSAEGGARGGQHVRPVPAWPVHRRRHPRVPRRRSRHGGIGPSLRQGEPQQRLECACEDRHAARRRDHPERQRRNGSPQPLRPRRGAGRSDLAEGHDPRAQIAANSRRDQAPGVGQLAGRQDAAPPDDADDSEREPTPALHDAEAGQPHSCSSSSSPCASYRSARRRATSSGRS